MLAAPPEVDVRFAPVAHALRDAIIEHYRDRGQSIQDDAGIRTLDTNSLLAARRGSLLLRALAPSGPAPDLSAMRVADLGCGFGALSLYFAICGAEVIGVDPNGERFGVGARVAREFRLPVTFHCGWLEDLVLPTSSFDLAVLNNSLCYVVARRARRRSLENVGRILVPDGRAVLRNPSRSSPTDPFTGLPVVHWLPPGVTQLLVRRRVPPRSPVRLRTAGGLKRELRRAGLHNVRTTRLDQPWWRPPRYQHHVARA